LVGFGSLKKKVLSGDERQAVYWTKKLFSIQENDEVMSIKRQIAETIKNRPSKPQLELYEKEVAELKQTIQNAEFKLAGKSEKVVQSEPTTLKTFALEKEIQAIIDETAQVHTRFDLFFFGLVWFFAFPCASIFLSPHLAIFEALPQIFAVHHPPICQHESDHGHDFHSYQGQESHSSEWEAFFHLQRRNRAFSGLWSLAFSFVEPGTV